MTGYSKRGFQFAEPESRDSLSNLFTQDQDDWPVDQAAHQPGIGNHQSGPPAKVAVVQPIALREEKICPELGASALTLLTRFSDGAAKCTRCRPVADSCCLRQGFAIVT